MFLGWSVQRVDKSYLLRKRIDHVNKDRFILNYYRISDFIRGTTWKNALISCNNQSYVTANNCNQLHIQLEKTMQTCTSNLVFFIVHSYVPASIFELPAWKNNANMHLSILYIYSYVPVSIVKLLGETMQTCTYNLVISKCFYQQGIRFPSKKRHPPAC